MANALIFYVLYLDFSKAFDKVETGVLLHKLRDGKVLGKVGCWLAAFLDSSNRQQAVVVNGRISGLSPVISGVPQGTVLRPVLFLLHIADIAREVSQGSATSSYVDDTRVNRSIADTATCCQALQDDLAGIYRWAEDVNMVFNSDKFECLRFWPGKTSKPDFAYKFPEATPMRICQSVPKASLISFRALSISLEMRSKLLAGVLLEAERPLTHI